MYVFTINVLAKGWLKKVTPNNGGRKSIPVVSVFERA